MQYLARQLFDLESKHGEPTDSSADITARVCERLRSSLSQFAGAVGFSSLLSRALTLARIQEPALKNVQVRSDGTLVGLFDVEKTFESFNAASGPYPGEVLVGQLLSLLVTFIGASIVIGLLRDAWPNETFSITGRKVEESK
jgi:hypothetical protein